MANTVIIFTLNGCGHCLELKNRLDENQIPYQEAEITLNRPIWNQVIDQTGLDILPTIFIRQEGIDSGPVYIPGRDYQTTDEIVEIIKSHI